MKTIPLFRKTVCAIVDDCDFERLSAYRWFWRISYKGIREVYRFDEQGKNVLMRHDVLNGEFNRTEPINGDHLDCRRENICAIFAQQDSPTRRYQGVWYDASAASPVRKWRASIKRNGKRKHLGWFATFEQARSARIAAEKDVYGDAINRSSDSGTSSE